MTSLESGLWVLFYGNSFPFILDLKENILNEVNLTKIRISDAEDMEAWVHLDLTSTQARVDWLGPRLFKLREGSNETEFGWLRNAGIEELAEKIVRWPRYPEDDLQFAILHSALGPLFVKRGSSYDYTFLPTYIGQELGNGEFVSVFPGRYQVIFQDENLFDIRKISVN